MVSRRRLLSRLGLLAVAGGAVWLVRDRLPWPPPRAVFAAGGRTPWIDLPARGGLIDIPGAIDGIAVRVVVDSGSQITAVDARLAARLGLPETFALPMLAYGVSGDPSMAHTVRLDLALPGLRLEGLRAAALDLAGLSPGRDQPFSVLLGRDALRQLVLEADLPRRRAAFHGRDAYRPPLDAIVMPLRLSGGAPMTQVRVEGSDLIDVMVDTGATGVLALSTEAAARAGLLAPGRDIRAAHSVSLGGLSLDRLVVARSLQAAGVTLREAPVQIYSPSARGAIPDGLLGTGLLRRFRFALDLSGARLFIVPQTPTIMVEPRP